MQTRYGNGPVTRTTGAGFVETSARRQADHSIPRLAWAFALVLCAWLACRLPPNNDVSWFLHVGRRLLAGDRMFVDVVEVNPPLIVWLAAAAAALASVLHVPSTRLFSILVCGLAGVSVWLCYLVARHRWGRSRALTLAAAASLALLALPGYDFGQREHLMVAFVLPYLVGAAVRLDGGDAGGWWTGALAGIGFALKPYFLPTWIGIELLTARRGARRFVRPESVAILAVFAAYAVAVLALEPDYIRQARAMAPLYVAFGPPTFLGTLYAPNCRLALVLLVLLPLGLLRRGARSLPAVLGLAAGLLALGALLQGKGYNYHWYPALSLAALGLCVALPRWRLIPPLLLTAGVALAVVRYRTVWAAVDGAPHRFRIVREAVRAEARGRPVLALSNRTIVLMPVVEEAGLLWDSPYQFLWQIQGLYRGVRTGPDGFPYHAPNPPVEQAILDGIWRQVERHPPGLVLVDEMNMDWEPEGFSQRGFFGRDPRFRALLNRCRQVRTVAGFDFLRCP
ncbi:MAG: hypothetical protein IRZ00_18430 [Gemmatimonadetes bacterium]|nr:hypothetical protein [Gemmatimonadota bacterium]